MPSKLHLSALALVGVLVVNPVRAGLDDLLKGAMQQLGGGDTASSVLSNSEVVSGLKEALGNGVETAVNALGKQGGFLGNSLVEIGVPDSMKKTVKLARKLGGEKYVDEFVSSMNQAAEKAVPDAAKILGDAVRDMSVEDAMGILKGPDDAATQYFRKVSEGKLSEKFLPIVKESTDAVGVTSAYKQVAGNAGEMLGGLLGGGPTKSLDLDQYVTGKTLDGLFKYIAIQEKEIRANPLARSSDLLKKVFGN
ncbi:MAG: DUF4197 domain-containing protein [Chromatiales bacterium]|nr:DUF4197 domain-containing protein [Chromatiales bacterium]